MVYLSSEITLLHLDQEIEHGEAMIASWHRQNEASQRLAAIPGVGLLTATALVATVGDAQHYRHGRQFAAALGLVPKQCSSGGWERLLGISIPIPHYPLFHTILHAGHDYLAPPPALSATG